MIISGVVPDAFSGERTESPFVSLGKYGLYEKSFRGWFTIRSETTYGD
jgi:hypothetical protein